ncbi:unnamed protein product [Mycena citricolor]|uniref:Uncharacterized protein n=1 Tax=Mycena citricolor TaxID=2018698 RepID=A0AAD2HJI6_9AGAR|nr:unnamed protein product [Mycena citricolor]
MRRLARSATERVVALLYYLPGTIAFDGGLATLQLGQVHVVACKPAYRVHGEKSGGAHIMQMLFDMVNARAMRDGCACMLVSGIPAYYRTQGYEYGLRLGSGLVTHPSALSPPKSADAGRYALRQGTQNDVSDLLKMALTSRETADLFFSRKDDAALRLQLEHLVASDTAPFFVLETTSQVDETPHIVAAVGVVHHNPGGTRAFMHPLLSDGEEDACAVTAALVPLLGPALEEAARKIVSEVKTITTLRWLVPDAHPLFRWLLANQVAITPPDNSEYDHMSVSWIAIPEFTSFFQALLPALNARLARAPFGKNYSAVLRIKASASGAGAIALRVSHGTVSIDPTPSREVEPNVMMPRAALIQLCMGYLEWRELKAVFSDFSVEGGVLPLVEVLFPKRSLGSVVNW